MTFSTFQEGVSNLRVMHSKQLFWLLPVGQARFPQLHLHVQFHHYLPDEFVPLLHMMYLPHLLLVQGLKISVELHFNTENHILYEVQKISL